jgi:ketosteroid isomerase-like protein
MRMDLVSRVRHAYQRFVPGDPAPMTALLADTATYHLPGRHLGGGSLCGRDAILRRMSQAARVLSAPPRVDLLHVAGAGAFVVTIERFHAERAGKVLDQEVCVVWRFEGERCVELWAHFTDQAACDAFWADGGDS